MHTWLFCVNCEGRNPDSHPYKHGEATNRPGDALTHSLRSRRARTSNQPDQTLTNQEDGKDTRADFPNMLSHKSEHHNSALIPPLEDKHFCVGASDSSLRPKAG
jgi:hypothetical protein